MTINAIRNPAGSGIRSALRGAVQNKKYSPLYTIKANPSVVSLPHFKNELVYTSDFREWGKSSGVVLNLSGIEIVAENGVNKYASISALTKINTKFGLLYNIIYCDLTANFAMGTGGVPDPTSLTKTLGNNKKVFTSTASISGSSIWFYTSGSEITGKKIKFKNVFIFELPAGSEIEADFAALSADELMIKYAPTNFSPGELKATVQGRTLKNELDYTVATYGEWTVAGTGTTKGATGIHLVADGINDKAYLPTTLKPSTKYGLLYNVTATDLDSDFRIGDVGGYGTYTDIIDVGLTTPKVVGNNKYSFTTHSTAITLNTLLLACLSTNTDGKYIDFKDIRLFELPTGSEIESDFTNMTADQLALKYPMAVGTDDKTGGVMSVGSKKATNLVTNGNFAQGTTGWIASSSTHSVNNGILTNMGNGASRYPDERKTTSISCVTGKKVYIRAYVTAKNNSLTEIIIQATGSGGGDNLTVKNQVSPVMDTQYLLTGIVTLTNQSDLLVLKILHVYADAATANGKAMEIKEVMVIELPATFGVGLEPSQATCDRIFADYFDGSRSVTQLRSVGKNLFDKSKVTRGKTLLWYDNTTTANESSGYSDYIPVSQGIAYTFSSARSFAFYNVNKIYDNSCSSNTITSFTPTVKGYIRFSIALTSLDTFQLELGSTATTYEPYRQTTCLIPEELRSIGTVADSFSSDGVFTKRIESLLLNGSQTWVFDAFNTAKTCINAYFVNNNVYKWVKASLISSMFRISDSAEWPFSIIAVADRTTRAHSIASSNNLNVIIPLTDLGTDYTTFNALSLEQKNIAIVAFFTANPMTFYYPLANPTTKKYNLAQLGCSGMKAEKSGTLYIEKVTGDCVETVPDLQLQYERSV